MTDTLVAGTHAEVVRRLLYGTVTWTCVGYNTSARRIACAPELTTKRETNDE